MDTERFNKRFLPKITVVENGCWEWQARSRHEFGYGMFFDGESVKTAHSVAYSWWVGPIPQGMVVRHFVCGNPPCCNPSHLRLGTPADNYRDSITDGTAKPIDTSKLTNEQRLTIKRDSRGPKILAPEYGVSERTIGKIQQRGNGKSGRPSNLTADQIAAIITDDRTQKVIAAEYECSQPTVSRLKRHAKTFE
jgi:hypothetical protein